MQNLEKVKQSNRREIAVEMELRLGDGDTASVNLAVNPLIDVNEEHIGSMLVLEDITSEKRVRSTMARYMSPEVADQLLAAGEAVLGGKDQKVSILFSDVRDFTAISEALGARETVSMLNEYFERMVDVVFSHGGVLDKFIGDAIMALFGVPFNGAARRRRRGRRWPTSCSWRWACSTATAAEAGKAPLDIGVGIATGVVVVGNIGSTRRMEYTAIGDSVNLASRLESATKYYGAKILISEATRADLRQPALLREIDRLRVKGKHEPVAIYEAMDHLTETVFPNLTATVERYAQGIQLYRAREFKDALGCFKEALTLHPGDKPSRIYVERCGALRGDAAPGRLGRRVDDDQQVAGAGSLDEVAGHLPGAVLFLHRRDGLHGGLLVLEGRVVLDDHVLAVRRARQRRLRLDGLDATGQELAERAPSRPQGVRPHAAIHRVPEERGRGVPAVRVLLLIDQDQPGFGLLGGGDLVLIEGPGRPAEREHHHHHRHPCHPQHASLLSLDAV